MNKNRSDIIPKQGSGASVDYPAALSAIAPYPAFCGVVAPAVSAARYCKCPSGTSFLTTSHRLFLHKSIFVFTGFC